MFDEVDFGGEEEVVVAFAEHGEVLVDEPDLGEVDGLVFGDVVFELLGNEDGDPLLEEVFLGEEGEGVEGDEVALDDEGLQAGFFDVLDGLDDVLVEEGKVLGGGLLGGLLFVGLAVVFC